MQMDKNKELSQKETILIVDDDDRDREFVRLALTWIPKLENKKLFYSAWFFALKSE